MRTDEQSSTFITRVTFDVLAVQIGHLKIMFGLAEE